VEVCLIIPPAATEFADPDEARAPLVEQRTKEAPLGILTIAAAVRQHGYKVRIVDLNATYYDYFDADVPHIDFCDFAADRIAQIKADLVGFGTICSSYPFTVRLADAVRRRCPAATIVAGGPQASVVDEESLKSFSCLDIIVRGEADETFPAVLECLKMDRSVESIPGITFRAGDRVKRNPNAPPVRDLDALPLPAFDLFENLSVVPSLSLEAGRGCPFACTFCSTNDFFRRRFRMKSPAALLAQMRELEKAYGARAFDFVHDMFTVDRRQVVEISEHLLASGDGYQWSCSARTDSVDDELLDLMARAGCRGIFYGIETGSQRMQRIIEKDLDIERAHSVIEACDKLDIPTTVSVITGFPEEQKDDLEQTVDFVHRASRLDTVSPQIHLIAPLAETPVLIRFREQLALDDIYSDLSHQGWFQHPADRTLIGAYPKIFPNFYAMPASVSRPYVRELSRFMYYSLRFFRWLEIGVQTWFGPLAFFDAWLEWRKNVTRNTDSGPRYYASRDFRIQFPTFVRETYIGPRKEEWAARVLADYELRKLEAFSHLGALNDPGDMPDSVQISNASVVHRAQGVAVFQMRGNVPAIIESLRLRTPAPAVDESLYTMSIRFSQAEVEAEATLESEVSSRLLNLFDGPSTVGQAKSQFCQTTGSVQGLSAETVFAYGLKRLIERELLVVAG
jgi:radical SAM superfamily enzyme YgiQ (UPF0313 family)